MTLPSEIKLALSSLIAMVVTEGVKALFKKEIPELAKLLTAVVFTGIISLSEGLLALVPVEYQGAVSSVLALVVSLLGAFGLHRIYKAVRGW